MTNLIIFKTNPVIFRTSLFILGTNNSYLEPTQSYQRTNRQNAQLGIKCKIGYFKLDLGDWGLQIRDEGKNLNWFEKTGIYWNKLENAGIG